MSMKNRKILLGIIIFTLVIIFGSISLFKINKGDFITLDAFPIEICNNEDGIYFIGKIFNCDSTNTYNLYKFDKKDNTIKKIHLSELKENFVIKKIAPWNGALYLIIAKADEENQYEIWKINDKEEVTFFYDLSEKINISVNDISSFCIDKNGINFIRCATETILINPVNEEIIRIPDISEDVSFESMAVGENGNVYALFCKNVKSGGGYEVVEFSNGQMKGIFSGDLLPYNDIYSVLGTGNKEYDIFIKGSKSVFGFNKDKQKAEYISPLSLDEYQYTKSCFIDGEKLLIFGMNSKIENGKTVNYTRLVLIDLKKKETAK